MCSNAFKMTNVSFHQLTFMSKSYFEIIAIAVAQVEIGSAEQYKLKSPLDSTCL